jgi:DNA ligase-1
MFKGFKPMLAVEADLKRLVYPVFASDKLDGIRVVVDNGVAYSRKLIAIPNDFVQTLIHAWAHQLDWHDGELVVGNAFGEGVFNRTTSGVMSKEGVPSFTFHVFDVVEPTLRFGDRYKYVERFIGHDDPHFVKVVRQYWIKNEDELLDLEQRRLAIGYEGLILRSPLSPYKYGRSTVKEGYLLKLKRFKDEEATVVGFKEQMHNGNEATKDNLGRTKRSSHKANKTGKGTLGKLVCTSKNYNDTFEVGTGFDNAQRDEIWTHQSRYMGALVKFKHQPYGQKDKPRSPVFLGWRDERDT